MKKILSVLLILILSCGVVNAKGSSGSSSHGGGHSSHSGSHSGPSHSGSSHSGHSHSGPSHSGHSHSAPSHSDHSSGGESHPVYLVNSSHHQEEVKFPNCDKHYALTDITTNYYSDGSRRVFKNSTIYNSNGTVLASDCLSLKHTVYEGNHYFLIRKGKGYLVIDSSGNPLTFRKYSRMEEVKPNRILVRHDKKYGIIDLKEETIVPLKYQSLEQNDEDVFIAKLNGYYGIIDINNNVLVFPDCEKIKPLYDTMVLKRYHKYGLVKANGEKILSPNYDKIKKLGEYILVKQNNKYGILDSNGNFVSEIIYLDVKLERNKLKGMKYKNHWVDIL